jgi:hypothetical protein
MPYLPLMSNDGMVRQPHVTAAAVRETMYALDPVGNKTIAANINSSSPRPTFWYKMKSNAPVYASYVLKIKLVLTDANTSLPSGLVTNTTQRPYRTGPFGNKRVQPWPVAAQYLRTAPSSLHVAIRFPSGYSMTRKTHVVCHLRSLPTVGT